MREEFWNEYRKIEKDLFITAICYVHNTEDAKDCLSEAAICGYKGYGRLRRKEYFKTWLMRIVINKCKDFTRKRRYTEGLEDNLGVFYNFPWEDIEITEAICRLKREEALYISLKFYNDMTYEEMARLLKQPVSTVKYRTGRAIEKLKKIMEV